MTNQLQPFVFGLEGKNNGCNFYRIRQPMLKLMEKNLCPVAISSELPTLEDQTLWLDKADVIFSQRTKSEKYLEFILSSKGRQKFVFDYDDNIYSVSPYNPSYQYHGTKEVTVTLDGNDKPIELWKEGVNDFYAEENETRIEIFTETLKAVDLVTTTSPILAGIFKKKGAKNIQVIKNYLDFSTWYPIQMQKDDFVTIGYQGGWSHYEDWLEIKEVLNEIMTQYPKTRLVVMGQHYKGALPNISADRIQTVPWSSMEIYPWRFKTLGIDIGICPLADNVFNHCKSEIKWEEYSALEIPTVASCMAPYNLAIEHGKTGFLALNKNEWIKHLSQLIESKELRIEMGREARKHVVENYNIDEKVYNYHQMIQSLYGRDILEHVGI